MTMALLSIELILYLSLAEKAGIFWEMGENTLDGMNWE